jgi:hypothetical protein
LQHLGWLSIRLNRLNGALPSEVGELSALSMLAISENLEGTLASELGLLTSLRVLSIKDCQLVGPIPSEFGSLSGLTDMLELMSSDLSGSIPTELGLLKSVQSLVLSGNQLTGLIPTELGQLTSLGKLSLSKNFLTGPIPLELSRLQQTLYTADFEDNPMLSGVVPEAICQLNSSCISKNKLDPCIGPFGLLFNCSSRLCGCGCDVCSP